MCSIDPKIINKTTNLSGYDLGTFICSAFSVFGHFRGFLQNEGTTMFMDFLCLWDEPNMFCEVIGFGRENGLFLLMVFTVLFSEKSTNFSEKLVGGLGTCWLLVWTSCLLIPEPQYPSTRPSRSWVRLHLDLVSQRWSWLPLSVVS